jgi:hypothetical protein
LYRAEIADIALRHAEGSELILRELCQLVALHIEFGDRPRDRLVDVEHLVAEFLELAEHLADRPVEMPLLDLDENRRQAAPEQRRATSEDGQLMSLDIDFDEVDLEGCADLVVQPHRRDLDSLDRHGLEPVGEAGLRGDQTVVLLRYLQLRMPRLVGDGDRPKLDLGSRLGQLPQNHCIGRVRFVAVHATRLPDPARQVIGEQPPARADVHDCRAGPDEVVGQDCGEVPRSHLAIPEDLDRRRHGGVTEAAADVSRRQVTRSPIHRPTLKCTLLRGQRLYLLS